MLAANLVRDVADPVSSIGKGAMNYLLVFIGGGIGLVLFYALGSVVFSIAGLFAGLALVRHLA
jgi:hypothetical protein